MDIVIASNNAHKVAEIKAIIGDLFGNVYTLRDKIIDIDIIEDGVTFYDNALIKARTISTLTGMPALSDDSGLEVDALGGAPGVYSARYSGDNANDASNNELLLTNLQGVSDRKANFNSTIVVYFPNGEIVSAEGKSYGTIIDAPRGTQGFGYDPLFECAEYGLTYAELSNDEKNAISHRAKALKALRSLLTSKLG